MQLVVQVGQTTTMTFMENTYFWNDKEEWEGFFATCISNAITLVLTEAAAKMTDEEKAAYNEIRGDTSVQAPGSHRGAPLLLQCPLCT